MSGTEQVIEKTAKQLLQLGYPKHSIRYNSGPEDAFADVLVTTEEGRPLIAVEIKVSSLLPTFRRQLERILRKTGAEYGVLTNGVDSHYYYNIGSDILEITSLPRYGEPIKPDKRLLKDLDDFESVFFRIADILRQKSPRGVSFDLWELQKILLCKYVDEKNPSVTPEFYVSSLKPPTQSWQSATKMKIDALFEIVKSTYPALFPTTETIRLDSTAVASIVSELQSYSVSRASTKLLKLIERAAQIDPLYWGEHQTPESLAKFLVKMVDPKPSETVLDPACGVGDFLAECRLHLKERFPSTNEDEYAATRLFGIEIDQDAARLAITSMILQGDGHSNVFVQDALQPPLEQKLRKVIEGGGFEIILLDPPLGGNYDRPISSETGSRNTSALFVERAVELTKRGGRIGVVVPENLLFSPSLKRFRQFLASKTLVKAIVSLPPGILRPLTSAKVSLMLLEKGTESSTSDYRVFMAKADREERLDNIANWFRDETLPSESNAFFIRAIELGDVWTVAYHALPPLEPGEPLEKFVQVDRGVAVPSSEYKPQGDHTVPYIRISDISEGTVRFGALKHVDASLATTNATVKSKDVLFSITGTIGKTALVNPQLEGALASTQIAILRPNELLVDPEYLAKLLTSRTIANQANRFLSGDIIEHFPISQLRKMPIALPPLKVQQSIIAEVHKAESELEVLKKRRRELEQMVISMFEAS